MAANFSFGDPSQHMSHYMSHSLEAAMGVLLEQHPDIRIKATRHTTGDYVEVSITKEGDTKIHRIQITNSSLASKSVLEIVGGIAEFIDRHYGEKKVKNSKVTPNDTPTDNPWVDEWVKNNA